MGYREKYDEWLTSTYFDADTKAELKEIESNEKEIEDRFYKDLEFGTAGLRGVIGAGTNRMNIYTVRKATQGLANYIAKKEAKAQGVAIAYDSRRMSPEFADEAALCLAANGIKAYVFESLRPTPELSFAVRKLGCIAGINITASHNPPEYNGYKVYWEDGAQITPPHDKGIMDEVKAVGTAIRLFSFGSLDRVLDAAHLLSPMYHGVNTLYKDPSDGFFVLALTQSSHTKSDFSKICNMLTEYGILEKSTPASLAYLEEHCETIYTQTAIQHLAKL